MLNNDLSKELEELKNWADAIFFFITKETPRSEPDNCAKIEVILNQTYKNQDLKGLKMISRDLTEWGKGLGKEKIALLNTILRSKFGDDLFNTYRKAKNILVKGKIEKMSEYKMLIEYLEEIYEDKSKEEDINKLNLMV